MIIDNYKIGDKVEIILNYFEMYRTTHHQKERVYFGTIEEILRDNTTEPLYHIKEIPNLNFYAFDLKPIE